MRLKNFTLLSIPLIAATSCCDTSNKGGGPNIIYILADDLGYGDISCYGQSKFSTPNIDRLAAEGMLFTQHYAGNPVSAASRSVLMTGQHTGHTPIRANKEMPNIEGQLPIAGESLTIAEMLKDAGYTTGCFGKWGLGYPGSEGDPNNQGFDEFFGYNCQRLAHRYYPEFLIHNDEKVYLEGNDTKNKAIYAPDLIQDRALDFIRDNRNKPFFAYLAFIQPHAELLVPDDEIYAQFKGKYEEIPYTAKSPSCEYGSPDFDVAGYPSQAMPRATFAAMVSRLDKYVGEVMAEVERLGLAENTIIIFSSDNGPHRAGGGDPDFFNGNGPWRGYKFMLTDGGIRVPMIARWPGVIGANTTSDHISAFWDVMPTFAQIAGVEIPETTDGISFLPTLKSQSQPQHDFLYWEFIAGGGNVAARMGDWKALNISYHDGPCRENIEIYNIVEDPEETTNLAAQRPDLVKRAEQIFASSHNLNSDFSFKFER